MRSLSLLTAVGAASLLAVAASPSPSASPASSPPPSPSPSPSPTPPPSSGQLNLSPASGPVGEVITITGSHFRPGEAVTLFWDNRDHTLIGATADAQGGFSTQSRAPEDQSGPHAVCALEPNQVCGGFNLQPRAPASPSPVPSPSESPPMATPAPAPPPPGPEPVSGPADAGQSGAISMLLQPPLVLVPVVLLIVLLSAAALWIRAGSRAAAPSALGAAVVSHRGRPPAAEREPYLPAPSREPESGSRPAGAVDAQAPGYPGFRPPRRGPDAVDEPPDLPSAGH